MDWIHGAKRGKLLVLDAGQGLGEEEEVRDVEEPRHMLNAELLSLNAVLQPVEAHVDALREARCDGLVDQTHADLIVTQEQGGRLWVSEVVKDETLFFGETSGSEEGGVLGLLYGGTDYRNGVSMTGERTVDEGKGIGRET